MTGPNGEKRPQGDVEAAVKSARMAVRERPKDSAGRERRTLLSGLMGWVAPQSRVMPSAGPMPKGRD